MQIAAQIKILKRPTSHWRISLKLRANSIFKTIGKAPKGKNRLYQTLQSVNSSMGNNSQVTSIRVTQQLLAGSHKAVNQKRELLKPTNITVSIRQTVMGNLIIVGSCKVAARSRTRTILLT